ncbi:MAG: SRPBCC domain-containing protein [Microscillaceae bacterium]|nr:SRPBCC domain-containing protein [Microscillaceae bacterium]
MKQYHTTITIQASVEQVWSELTDFSAYPQWNPIVGKLEGKMQEGNQIATYIVPLGKTFHPTLLSFKPQQEIVWQGAQGAKFLLAGKHYYRLEKISPHATRLLHGEYFTGLFSYFIAQDLLQKMIQAFESHNQLLKQRIENGKK